MEIEQLGSLQHQDMDANANAVGPEGIQGHIDDNSDLMLDEDEYEEEDEEEDEDHDKTFLELLDEKKLKHANESFEMGYCH